MHEEIEIKLRVSDVALIRKRLNHLQAREISPRTHESNTLYDTPANDLRRRDQLIRIRIEQPASKFGKRSLKEDVASVLTYKGPPHGSSSAKRGGTHSKLRKRFKVRQESEVAISGASEMAGVLRALGFHPVFRYEKFRTTYVLPGVRGLKVELDETPVGIYLELEGPVAAIEQGARLLGYGRKEYMTDTYGSLYLAACCHQGRKPGHMLFSATKKMR